MLFEKDVNNNIMKSKNISIIGYGSQGRAQALCLRDSGLDVFIGVRKGKSWEKAKSDGFVVMPIKDAVKKSEVIHLLVPDEDQKEVYEKEIRDELKEGQVLSFSHGFNVFFKQIVPPNFVDVIMVAPNGIANKLRENYISGEGVPGIISVYQDFSGRARSIALGIANALKLTKKGVVECSFKQETVVDLFAEQTVLCGGLFELIKKAYEVLVGNGYPKEIAYFSLIHELKLVVDTIYEKGLVGTNEIISNTAEYGEYVNGPKLIDNNIKKRMEEILKSIEDGSFAKEWIKENEKGLKTIKEKRKELKQHDIEKTREEINNRDQGKVSRSQTHKS